VGDRSAGTRATWRRLSLSGPPLYPLCYYGPCYLSCLRFWLRGFYDGWGGLGPRPGFYGRADAIVESPEMPLKRNRKWQCALYNPFGDRERPGVFQWNKSNAGTVEIVLKGTVLRRRAAKNHTEVAASPGNR